MVVRSWIGPQRHTARKSKGEKVVQETTGAFGNKGGQATPIRCKVKQEKELARLI